MQQKQSNPETKLKDASKRVYTSLNQNMPAVLSYQNIKLANFLELELTDLWDSLLQVNENNFKNQLKETLSRSYNAFHEMKKLFNDLDMSFLYEQTKKLVSCYGVIFVYMLDKIQKQEKSLPNGQSKQSEHAQKKMSNFQKQINDNIKILKQRTSNQLTRRQKRQKGIHLYNQSYARCIDYDIEYFREIRNKQKEKNKTDEQKILIKIQQDRKFKKQVMEEINDLGSIKVDGEELYLFLNRHKMMSQTGDKICLGDQLQKIAVFFKESQHQALEFLRKERNLQNFHELTEGFNVIIADYENCKANQIFFVQDKIKQIFEYIKSKVESLQRELEQKEKIIKALIQLSLKKKREAVDSQTQTFLNFEQQLKQLHRKILTSQTINSQLKTYIGKSNEQDRKQKLIMLHRMNTSQSNYKQTKELLEEKNKHIAKIQKRLKILQSGSKSKNLFDPIDIFIELSQERKEKFLQDLRERGFINNNKKNSRYSSAKNSRMSVLDRKQSLTAQNQNSPLNPNNINNESSQKSLNVGQHKRRQSSFFKKASSQNLYSKDSQSKNHTNIDDKNIGKNGEFTIIQQQNSGTSNNPSQNERGRPINSSRDRQRKINSRKIITIRPLAGEQEQKPKVFDIKQANGLSYSQKNLNTQYKLQSKIALINSTSTITNLSANNISEDEDKQRVKNNQMNEISEDSEDDVQDNQNLPRKKRLNAFETAQVTQHSVEDGPDHINQSQGTKDKVKDSQTLQKSPTKKHKKNHRKQKKGRQQAGSDQEKGYRSAAQRTSCEEALERINQENLGKFQHLSQKINEKWEQQVLNRRNQFYKRCSIVNQVSISIDSKGKVDSLYSDKNKASCINLIRDLTQKNERVTEGAALNRASRGQNQKRWITKQTQPECVNTKMKQNMKTTSRKLKYMKSTNQINAILMDHQKTKQNLRNNSVIGSKSLSNTFHRDTQSRPSKPQENCQSFQNTTISNLKALNSKNSQGISSDAYPKNLVSQNQTNQTRLLQQQLGEDQIIEASRNCATSQQFQARVLKLHESKCGKSCKHLQRFLEIFEKIRKQNLKNRKQIKLHIQNLNDKLGTEESVNFPYISKK